MKPFWRYYGGKWAAAPHYPRPRHGLIVEPFAGAAGYSTRFGAGCDVVLVDANPVICAIWQWLISATPDDVLSVGDVPDGGTVDDIDAPQAARWLAGFWCNDATTMPCKRPSKFAQRGPDTPQWGWGGWNWRSRQRIAEQVPHIRHWTVIEGDYTAAPDVRATWFVDPPYQGRPGSYYPKQPGSFPDLGAWCRERQGLVIACEADGANWLPFVPLVKRRAVATSRTGRGSVEAVWVRDDEGPLKLFGDTLATRRAAG